MARSHDVLHPQVADIDRRLVLAYANLTLVRGGFVRCPTPARESACRVAEEQLDELLDLRLAVTRSRG
jgi:hypothetical protein